MDGMSRNLSGLVLREVTPAMKKQAMALVASKIAGFAFDKMSGDKNSSMMSMLGTIHGMIDKFTDFTGPPVPCATRSVASCSSAPSMESMSIFRNVTPTGRAVP